mmetsp:Transcript_696/g.2019  ORF Transcript_696/g.2019 Transcript_696/m.2019 type:complete len:476 (-) Transcript_696:168-1595(-)
MAEVSGATPDKPAEQEGRKGKKRRKDNAADGDNDKEKIELPPARSIFKVCAPHADGDGSAGHGGARTGELLGQPTPRFVVLTSRCMPLYLRPQVLASGFRGEQQIFELPIGDLLLRPDVVAKCPDAAAGCRGFWPHLRGHLTYCSFRNPQVKQSVYGGDAVCSVETSGGRRKVGPKEVLDTQRVMRTDIVALPGEEVPLDLTAARRLHRGVSRAADWLKEILEAKAQDPSLSFDWHVLASIQGGGEVKLRQKACLNAAAMPVAGFWVGGLGYDESLSSRAKILDVVSSALPREMPRFLPLNVGTPIEVIQAVLLGMDVFELTYPTHVAVQGVALTFSWEMPADDATSGGIETEEVLGCLLPAAEGVTPSAPPLAVRQLHLRAPEFADDFEPISQTSFVSQYSRAYVCHLLGVRELLGTMLLVQHNLHAYDMLFAAIREHIRQGTFRHFAAWFMRTQTCEPVSSHPLATPPARTKS